MKKLLCLVTTLFMLATSKAQSPDKMSYQAVVRNSSNELVVNKQVGMRISILQGSAICRQRWFAQLCGFSVRCIKD